MCGIITSISFNKEKFNNIQRVLQQFKSQRFRGTNGFGFISVNKDKKKVVFYRSKDEDNIKERLLENDVTDSDILMFHHRIPTSSPNTPLSNHPIPINSKGLDFKYFLIHNGNVSNCSDLKEEHEKLDIHYNTEIEVKDRWEDTISKQYNDSESLGIELALLVERKKETLDVRGDIACFLLQMTRDNKPLNLIFFRNGNPINFYRNQAGIFFSSEGKGEKLKRNKLFILNLSNYKLTSVDFKILSFTTSKKPFLLGENKDNFPSTPVDEIDNWNDVIYRDNEFTFTKQDVGVMLDEITELSAKKVSLEEKIDISSTFYVDWGDKIIESIKDEITNIKEEINSKITEIDAISNIVTGSPSISRLLLLAEIDKDDFDLNLLDQND